MESTAAPKSASSSSSSLTHRPDGRASGGTLRPLSCELGLLPRADGSASFKAGSTHVLCGVYGPIAPKLSVQEDWSKATLSVIMTQAQSHESMLSQVLEGCILVEKFPRTVIEIVVQVVQDDGSVLACAIHAIVCALMDAGIPMRHLPIATTCCFVASNDDTLQLDPIKEEEEGAAATGKRELSLDNNNNSTQPTVMTLIQACGGPTGDGNKKKLLGTTMEGGGQMSLETLLRCEGAASRASIAVVTFIRMAMEQKVTKQSETLLSSYQ